LIPEFEEVSLAAIVDIERIKICINIMKTKEQWRIWPVYSNEAF